MNIQEEYGSVGNAGFLNATLHDSTGKEIEIPCCPKCKCLMQILIGKNASMWYCTEC